MRDLIGKHSFKKRGIYYFERRIPIDLENYYSKKKLVISLKTKNKVIALKLCTQLTHKLDLYWSYLRNKDLPKLFYSNFHAQESYLGFKEEVSIITFIEFNNN